MNDELDDWLETWDLDADEPWDEDENDDTEEIEVQGWAGINKLTTV